MAFNLNILALKDTLEFVIHWDTEWDVEEEYFSILSLLSLSGEYSEVLKDSLILVMSEILELVLSFSQLVKFLNVSVLHTQLLNCLRYQQEGKSTSRYQMTPCITWWDNNQCETIFYFKCFVCRFTSSIWICFLLSSFLFWVLLFSIWGYFLPSGKIEQGNYFNLPVSSEYTKHSWMLKLCFTFIWSL